MIKSRNLLASPSHKQKLCEKHEAERRKVWHVTSTRICVISALLALLLSFCAPVGADSFPPTPSQHIVVDETCISVSLTTATRTIFINVTEYDAKQMLKNVTAEFYEPISYVSFTWKVLSKRPSYLDPIDNSTVLHYYAITFSTATVDQLRHVKMDFAIEKDAEEKKNADEENLTIYRYNGEKMEECTTEKVAEDDEFVYFRTETDGSPSYVVVTGGIASSPWCFAMALIAVAALITLIGIYCYKKFKLTNLRKISRTVHGE